jgi:hypothetical protein
MTEEELNNSPEEIETEPQTEIELPDVEKSYDKIFAEITKIEEGQVIVRQDCKFCMHPARIEAEQKYEQTKSWTPVAKFFKDYQAEHPDAPTMNIPNIRNHILNHYMQQEKKAWLKEYTSRLSELMNYKVGKDRMFEMLSATLELKLHEIASDPTLDLLKQADTMTKLVKAMLDVFAIQSRLRGEIQAVNIFTQAFQGVWANMIKKEDDPRVKRRLMIALESFQSQLEGTIAPETE